MNDAIHDDQAIVNRPKRAIRGKRVLLPIKVRALSATDTALKAVSYEQAVREYRAQLSAWCMELARDEKRRGNSFADGRASAFRAVVGYLNGEAER